MNGRHGSGPIGFVSEHSLASSSALSLPITLVCAGTQKRVTL